MADVSRVCAGDRLPASKRRASTTRRSGSLGRGGNLFPLGPSARATPVPLETTAPRWHCRSGGQSVGAVGPLWCQAPALQLAEQPSAVGDRALSPAPPLRKPGLACAPCLRSWRSSSAGVSRPRTWRLAPPVAGHAFGRHCATSVRAGAAVEAIVDDTAPARSRSWQLDRELGGVRSSKAIIRRGLGRWLLLGGTSSNPQ